VKVSHNFAKRAVTASALLRVVKGRNGPAPQHPQLHLESNVMTFHFKAVLSAVALSMVALATQAQPAPAASMPRVEARQANQEARIAQGAASGSLTPREQRRLNKEQKAIAHGQAKAEADGKATKAERRHLHKMQDKASADIRHQKHDAQKVAKPASAP
jgi:hypothetical protein